MQPHRLRSELPHAKGGSLTGKWDIDGLSAKNNRQKTLTEQLCEMFCAGNYFLLLQLSLCLGIGIESL